MQRGSGGVRRTLNGRRSEAHGKFHKYTSLARKTLLQHPYYSFSLSLSLSLSFSYSLFYFLSVFPQLALYRLITFAYMPIKRQVRRRQRVVSGGCVSESKITRQKRRRCIVGVTESTREQSITDPYCSPRSTLSSIFTPHPSPLSSFLLCTPCYNAFVPSLCLSFSMSLRYPSLIPSPTIPMSPTLSKNPVPVCSQCFFSFLLILLLVRRENSSLATCVPFDIFRAQTENISCHRLGCG